MGLRHLYEGISERVHRHFVLDVHFRVPVEDVVEGAN